MMQEEIERVKEELKGLEEKIMTLEKRANDQDMRVKQLEEQSSTNI